MQHGGAAHVLVREPGGEAGHEDQQLGPRSHAGAARVAAQHGGQRVRASVWMRSKCGSSVGTCIAYTVHGRWQKVAPGGGVGRYAALRCLWREIRVDERTNR
eukprot:1806534-Prymnesium_polylepis.1